MLFIRSRKSLFILIISEKLKYGKISLHNTAKVNNFGACENRSNYAVATQFPQVTQRQIDDWKEKEEEMKAIPGLERSTKFTLHKGPKTKYKELYQVLYQTVKELREEIGHC